MAKNTKAFDMKRLFYFLFSGLCLFAFMSCNEILDGADDVERGQSVTIMSFNVRSMNMTEQKVQDKWDNRRDACCSMINFYRPVMLGVQECARSQRDYIKRKCRGYDVLGISKDSDENGEQNCIFYLEDSITVLKSGTFWLTDTPDRLSKLDGHYHYRTATWIKALHKSTNKEFYHINTHLDNCGNNFRSIELGVLLKFIKDNCADCPVVMTADWNEHDEHDLFNELYKTFKNARFTASTTDRGTTFNNFGANTADLRIDHVFYKGFSSCSKFAVDRQAWAGHAYISDHYPVYAVLNF
jgi:endonuclease/exonuclease/phosphatase family metal-dependent hydrolase